MKIFIDTADLDEIKEAISWGIVDGVTTNPSLIKKSAEKAGGSMEGYIKEICSAACGKDVSLEVVSLDAESMYREAKILHEKFNPIARNVVIKIPVWTSDRHYEGIKTIARLSREGIKVNATLIMKPEQALLAAKAGARYASPFAGRTDDAIRDKHIKETSGSLLSGYKKEDYFPSGGMGADDDGIVSGVDLVRKIVEIYKNYSFQTEVIAASLRNSRQVREVALAGAHVATIPFPVLQAMVQHFKTAEGIKKFCDDVVPEYKKLFE